jgi:hypothetical protein
VAIGVDNLVGDGTNCKAVTNAVPSGATAAPAGKLVSLEGDTAGSATGGTANDGVISSLTVTNATP